MMRLAATTQQCLKSWHNPADSGKVLYDNAYVISAAVSSGPAGQVVRPAWWLIHSVSVTEAASGGVTMMTTLHSTGTGGALLVQYFRQRRRIRRKIDENTVVVVVAYIVVVRTYLSEGAPIGHEQRHGRATLSVQVRRTCLQHRRPESVEQYSCRSARHAEHCYVQKEPENSVNLIRRFDLTRV